MRDRTAALATLRELDVAIKVHRAELAALERARDVLERVAHDHPDRCNAYHPSSPCSGLVSARYCYRCGEVIRRCVQHGGLRAATHYLDLHYSEHGGSDVRDPSAEDAGRVSARGEAMPVGRLSSPSPDRDREGEAEREQRRTGDNDQAQPGELGEDVGRPSTGPSAIRRRASRSDVDR